MPYIAMSGTITKKMSDTTIPDAIGMRKPVHVISVNPDRPNIRLTKYSKPPSLDVNSTYEAVLVKECKRLHLEKENYPVTLLYCTYPCCARGLAICRRLFGGNASIETALFSAIYSKQTPGVINLTMAELKKPNPRFRLIFCTASVGMGFDAPSIERVIHERPPRNILDYMQQFGRAGRCGQPADAILFYNNSNIAPNLPGIQDNIIEYCKNDTSCLRKKLLSSFGYEDFHSEIKKCRCCSWCHPQCDCNECTPLP